MKTTLHDAVACVFVKKDKALAVSALLGEDDGDVLLVIPTIESLTVDHSLVYAVSGGRFDFTALSRVFGGLQRLFGKRPDESMGVGGTVAVTSTGVVIFENDHKRVPRKRIRRFDGYDSIGPRTNADLLTLQLHSATLRVQPSQRETLLQLSRIVASAS